MCPRKVAMLLLSFGIVVLINLAAANSVMAQKEGLILHLPFDEGKGNETIERSYNVTITDERLTQVIYTRRKGPYKRWGWSGFTIQASL